MKYILFVWGVVAGLYCLIELGVTKGAIRELVGVAKNAMPEIDVGVALITMTLGLGLASIIHAIQQVRKVLTDIRDRA